MLEAAHLVQQRTGLHPGQGHGTSHKPDPLFARALSSYMSVQLQGRIEKLGRDIQELASRRGNMERLPWIHVGVAPKHAILILALSYRQHDTQHAEVLQRALRPLDTRVYGKAYLHVQECWRSVPLILQRLVHMLSASVLSVRGRPV